MEANWTTFLLEAVNFLVLVWILKRFLYKPVLRVIERRRADIERTLAEARGRQADAEALDAKARERMAQLDAGREAAQEALDKDLAAERARRMDEILKEVEAARARAGALRERQAAEEEHRRELRAVRAGLAFTARLLARVADTALEGRLVDMAVEDLGALPEARAGDLREAVAASDTATVASAGPLNADRRKALTGAVEAVLGGAAPAWAFVEDPELIAGVRVTLGPWVLKANLKDELEFFAGGVPD